MAAVVLECSQHGDFDSFDVIRSDTSMAGLADNALPVPIATGLQTMYYVDSSVVPGGKYYYKFRVWRDGVSQDSDEIKVYCFDDPLDEYVVSLLYLDETFEDLKGNIWTARSTGTKIENGMLSVAGGVNNGLFCANTSFLNFGTDDFCFECEGEINLAQTSDALLSTGLYAWAFGQAILNLENQKMRYVFYGPPVVEATTAVPLNQLNHFAFSRQGGIMRTFLNGIKLTDNFYPTEVNFSNNGAMLFGNAFGALSPTGKFKRVRITKGHARYTANFTPPTA